MLKTIKQRLKLEPIPRVEGATDRLVNLTLFARFTDELLGGLPDVLMPTIRTVFGLSYTQVSLLWQLLFYVASLVEPIIGLMLDIWSRRWLIAIGAAGVSIAIMTVGAANTFGLLIVAFIIYGLTSGALAHTADVTLVETHPKASDRIFTRATMIDTIGALLAPALVAAAVWLGVSWRILMIIAGMAGLGYAFLLFRTPYPSFNGSDKEKEASLFQTLKANIGTVLRSRQAMLWLAYLFVHEITETRNFFVPLWLHDDVGMNQALIGVFKAMDMGVGLITLLLLDRWLVRFPKIRILQVATVAALILYPAWVLLPGIATRFILAVPMGVALSVFWPIGKSASLASVPGKGGTVTAIDSLLGFIPLPIIFGWLADRYALTTVILWGPLIGFALLFLLSFALDEPVAVTEEE